LQVSDAPVAITKLSKVLKILKKLIILNNSKKALEN
jgi:hypothetical protein